jgi:hypothetical protein
MLLYLRVCARRLALVPPGLELELLSAFKFVNKGDSCFAEGLLHEH